MAMRKYNIFNFNSMGLMSDGITVTAESPKKAVQSVYPGKYIERDSSWRDVVCTDLQNGRRYGYALLNY